MTVVIDDRPSFEELGILTAELWGMLRGTCSRKKVGAVLMKENRIIAIGYNGAPSKMDHCNHRKITIRTPLMNDHFTEHEIENDTENSHCSVSLHAETNVYSFAGKMGISTDGTTLCVPITPCYQCALHRIVPSGTTKVVWANDYRADPRVIPLFEKAGIVHQRIKPRKVTIDLGF